MYPGLSVQQLQKFYPGKEDVTNSILSHLIRQGRIYHEESFSGFFSAQAPATKDKELTDAVWILLDFLDHIEFHSVSDFPVKLLFFADGELYEVISIPSGQEPLLSHLLKQQDENCGKRILMVEHPEQIAILDIPHVSGFCTVAADGNITYYKKQ